MNTPQHLDYYAFQSIASLLVRQLAGPLALNLRRLSVLSVNLPWNQIKLLQISLRVVCPWLSKARIPLLTSIAVRLRLWVSTRAIWVAHRARRKVCLSIQVCDLSNQIASLHRLVDLAHVQCVVIAFTVKLLFRLLLVVGHCLVCGQSAFNLLNANPHLLTDLN